MKKYFLLLLVITLTTIGCDNSYRAGKDHVHIRKNGVSVYYENLNIHVEKAGQVLYTEKEKHPNAGSTYLGKTVLKRGYDKIEADPKVLSKIPLVIGLKKLPSADVSDIALGNEIILKGVEGQLGTMYASGTTTSFPTLKHFVYI